MTMPLQYRRSQLVEDIYIPPLKIPVSDSQSQKVKDPTVLTFLKAIPLVENTNFLKQKSLYRFAISRKPCRDQMSKSYVCFPQERIHNRYRSKSRIEQTDDNKRSLSKNNSVQQIKCQVIQSRQPYFKRKNRNNPQTIKQKQFIEKTIKSSLYNQNCIQNKNYRKINNEKQTNINRQRVLKGGGRVESESCIQLYKKLQVKVVELQNQIQELLVQNTQLKDKLIENQSKREEMSKQLVRLSYDNEKLLMQVKKNIKIHSDSFINENKLENQLILRDNMIHQLQTSLKYVELENVTFKKYKGQCSKQADIIYKLQKDKKILEEKIKILCRRKTKRSKTKGSLISQYSDLSLNFSLDQQDCCKKQKLPKTAERTPEKFKNILKPAMKSQQKTQLTASQRKK